MGSLSRTARSLGLKCLPLIGIYGQPPSLLGLQPALRVLAFTHLGHPLCRVICALRYILACIDSEKVVTRIREITLTCGRPTRRTASMRLGKRHEMIDVQIAWVGVLGIRIGPGPAPGAHTTAITGEPDTALLAD